MFDKSLASNFAATRWRLLYVHRVAADILLADMLAGMLWMRSKVYPPLCGGCRASSAHNYVHRVPADILLADIPADILWLQSISAAMRWMRISADIRFHAACCAVLYTGRHERESRYADDFNW
ncbi:MAG: hypothetical protein WC340_03600 [Kiritimatiellia bacterium]